MKITGMIQWPFKTAPPSQVILVNDGGIFGVLMHLWYMYETLEDVVPYQLCLPYFDEGLCWSTHEIDWKGYRYYCRVPKRSCVMVMVSFM